MEHESGDTTAAFDESRASDRFFFGLIDEPSVGPEMNQLIDMKNHHSEGLVDDGCFLSHDASTVVQLTVELAIIQALRTVGVVDPGVLAELAHEPLSQMERAIRNVDRIRRTDDPRRPA